MQGLSLISKKNMYLLSMKAGGVTLENAVLNYKRSARLRFLLNYMFSKIRHDHCQCILV